MPLLVSFIFISHASVDKQRLKPLLWAMVRRNIPIWIDHPERVDPELAAACSAAHRLRWGEPWRDGIAQGLDACCLALVFWTIEFHRAT